jgi:hypothetical protein
MNFMGRPINTAGSQQIVVAGQKLISRCKAAAADVADAYLKRRFFDPSRVKTLARRRVFTHGVIPGSSPT